MGEEIFVCFLDGMLLELAPAVDSNFSHWGNKENGFLFDEHRTEKGVYLYLD